jgi:hypothetical protein
MISREKIKKVIENHTSEEFGRVHLVLDGWV